MISKVLKLLQLSRLIFLSLINQSNEFMICKNYPINFTKRNKIYEGQLNVAMNYDKFKDLSDRLNIIPLFHASIVVNKSAGSALSTATAFAATATRIKEGASTQQAAFNQTAQNQTRSRCRLFPEKQAFWLVCS